MQQQEKYARGIEHYAQQFKDMERVLSAQVIRFTDRERGYADFVQSIK